MHSSPTKTPPKSHPKWHPPSQTPIYNTLLIYITSICIAHTRSTKQKWKKRKKAYFWKGMSLLFLQWDKSRETLGFGWWVTHEEDEGVDFVGIVTLPYWGLGVTQGTAGGARTELSCRPSFWQAHPFDRGTFALIQGGPAQSQRWMELIPVLIAVAALVGAATTAQAINGRASRVLTGRGILGRRYPTTVAPRRTAGAISRRRNRFGLDVQALSRRQGEIWTLT